MHIDYMSLQYIDSYICITSNKSIYKKKIKVSKSILHELTINTTCQFRSKMSHKMQNSAIPGYL